MKTVHVCLISSLFLSSFIGCTKSPFGEDKISTGTRSISGKVFLEGTQTSDGAYIWLESFNIGTFTDENGSFKITLPTPSTQGIPGGVSGIYNMFFYVANYGLQSTKLAVQNGNFLYGNGEINEDGELDSIKELNRILRIRIRLNPDTVSLDSSKLIQVEVALLAMLDTITVYYPKDAGNKLAPLILRNIDSGEITIFDTTFQGIAPEDQMTLEDDSAYFRNVVLNIGRGAGLNKGTYEIIPYLIVKHDSVPAELLESLGPTVTELGDSYVNMPFKREGDFLTIN